MNQNKEEKQIIEDFISSIVGGKEPPISGEEGRKTVAVIDAIKRSLGPNSDEA